MEARNVGKEKIGVLLMTEGSPTSLDDAEAFLMRIRNGIPPKPEEVQEIKRKYSKIGGRSPLLERTKEQADALEKSLNRQAIPAKVYVGMKYWHPLIDEALAMTVRDGIRRIIAIALAPFFSQISIGGYEKYLLESQKKINAQLDISFVKSWNNHPLFLQAWIEKIQEALTLCSEIEKDRIFTVFTAHTLPEKILEWDDPYPRQLRTTCQWIAEALDIKNWNLSYQSGVLSGKCLGPDILTTLKELGWKGYQNILVVPIGFVATHFEILYYLDIECQAFAQENDINLWRTESLGTTPAFIAALTSIVEEYLVNPLESLRRKTSST